MTDLAGVRIITYTQSDAERVCNLLSSIFSIDKENSENKSAVQASRAEPSDPSGVDVVIGALPRVGGPAVIHVEPSGFGMRDASS